MYFYRYAACKSVLLGTNQVLIQRALGAENLKEGQKGVLLSGFLKMMVPLLLVIPGVIAARLVPSLTKPRILHILHL